ncbi:MAG TPA: EAL domain-containing protein [Pyrinomonadaceae bacterium]|nr:EAL domain-containing protein [Pyrinomonadaceae bacterium]
MNKPRLNAPYMWLVIFAGASALVWAALHLDRSRIDLQFFLVACVTVIFGSRIGVPVPRVKSEITVSDTFIFLVLMLYGGPAAILLAGAEAFCSSMRFAGRWFTRCFNGALLALSTFITVSVLKICFGATDLYTHGYSQRWIITIFVMASVQYVANSSLAAFREMLKRNEPFFDVWQKHFLWTSITYYAGASAAAIISQLVAEVGLPAFIIALPIVAIIFATYSSYRSNIHEAEEHAKEQERFSKQLMEREEHFRNAFDHAAGMALISPIGHWLQVNRALCQILEFTEAELLQKNFQELTHPDDLPDDLVHIYQVLEGKTKVVQREKRYLNRSGQEIWVLQSASLVRSADGEPQHVILQIQDITDRKEAEAKFQHAALHDALTGLPNRTLLTDRLRLAIVRMNRTGIHQFAVLFLDVDRFKIVNDSLGHSFGDQLLVEMSRRLERCVRKMDTVARLGGDEFAVLLDGVAGPHEAIQTAERILESVSRPCTLGDHEVVGSASIGIAFSQTGYQTPEDMLRDADTAMYRAKSNGKARYEVFDVKMHAHAVEALTLERELRHAIDHGEIQVYYQPIVSLADSRLAGFEALARWDHPRRGFISPSAFIPIAEETGMIVTLGLHVLRTACQQLRIWQAHDPSLGISVNVSGRQFADSGFVDRARRILEETEVSASSLRLEVTESVIMDKAEIAADALKALKSLGVQLSIDDFGTGYSSLSYLHKFPFDILKIDQSFVSRMCLDQDSKGIAETILILARKLNKRAVAEGIEDEEQLAELRKLGCDFGQGYYFSRPVPAAEAEQLVLNQRTSNSFEVSTIPAEQIVVDSFAM